MVVGLERDSQHIVDLALYRRALCLHRRTLLFNPGSTKTLQDVYKSVLKFEANAAEGIKHDRAKVYPSKATTKAP